MAPTVWGHYLLLGDVGRSEAVMGRQKHSAASDLKLCARLCYNQISILQSTHVKNILYQTLRNIMHVYCDQQRKRAFLCTSIFVIGNILKPAHSSLLIRGRGVYKKGEYITGVIREQHITKKKKIIIK